MVCSARTGQRLASRGWLVWRPTRIGDVAELVRGLAGLQLGRFRHWALGDVLSDWVVRNSVCSGLCVFGKVRGI